MRGPYRRRRIHLPPRFGHFKPAGVPARLLTRTDLSLDEYEAIRLADYEGLEHLQVSDKMGISRPTFTRLIEKARHKVAEALIEGKELVFTGGNVDLVKTLHQCTDCGEVEPKPVDHGTENCPDCGSENVEDPAQLRLGAGPQRKRRGRGQGQGRGRGQGRARNNDDEDRNRQR